jgi:hypothetical protein
MLFVCGFCVQNIEHKTHRQILNPQTNTEHKTHRQITFVYIILLYDTLIVQHSDIQPHIDVSFLTKWQHIPSTIKQ